MNLKNLSSDIRSGIVIFLVALPLCLGISLACKMPLFSGILSGVIGGIVVTIFSGSVLSVTGPAAGLTAIVLSSIASLGSVEVFMAAVLIAGIVQLILGFIRAGSIGNYIPFSVIKGMLAGIGVILIIKQIPHLVGYDADPEGEFEFAQADGHNTFSELFYMFNDVSIGVTIVSVLSLLFLFFSETSVYKKSRVLSMLPAPLAVVLFGIVLNIVFRSSSIGRIIISKEHLVNLPVINGWGDLENLLIHPDFSMLNRSSFWIIVFTLAFVASLETLLSIEAVDKLDPKKRHSDTNKELIAQGIGNVFCGFLGALPVTAVIVRSAANVNAGARSKWSAIFHAVLLTICVLLFPHFLMHIPNASLAAILVFTGYKLAKPAIVIQEYRKGIQHLLPFVLTVVVMLLTDLLIGVLSGLVLAIIFIIRNNIIATFEIRKEKVENVNVYNLILPQHLTFFNKGFLLQFFSRIEANDTVVIDGSRNRIKDKDSLEVIADFVDAAPDKSISIEFKNFNLEK